MKKPEKYISQFDFDDLSTEETVEKEMSKCQKCGKPSVSLYEGVCFDCRKKEPAKNFEKMFDEEKKQKNNITFILSVIFVVISGLILFFFEPYFAAYAFGRALYRGLSATCGFAIWIVIISAIRSIIKLISLLFKKIKKEINKQP